MFRRQTREATGSRERTHRLDLIASGGDGTRKVGRIGVDARVGATAHLARHASRLEAKQRLPRAGVAQERGDLVARAEHQNLAAAPHARARREPFAFEDRARTRRFAPWRTELEQIARWPGRDGATREKKASQVGSPAALAPQRRPS